MRKVFYCDDDQDDLMMLRDVIRKIDPEIDFEFTDDSETVLNILHASAKLPDVIFLDINMPRVSGTELLQELKNDPTLKSIPVFMYSTTRESMEANRCRELGAEDLLQKLPGMEESFVQIRSALAQLQLVGMAQ
ncbi:MAG TPA: response regulator [Cyclobacteriaceae bacterium]|nr:response regulator [Cyclobacteriaceae bacterium]HMV09333.1 response regulator [Cyclobacteriaceae bacterium]HMV91383.1 response regulator [Cyclobacteriaceae bacterium]HMX01866.1 response regulator [Cyclobacteriaceae bacterium]HMX50790.1 response regulator [Cyclobacteriaceae bacterium]